MKRTEWLVFHLIFKSWLEAVIFVSLWWEYRPVVVAEGMIAASSAELSNQVNDFLPWDKPSRTSDVDLQDFYDKTFSSGLAKHLLMFNLLKKKFLSY